ncbi:MAG: DNA-3-methyladenine glycosylase I [Dehalococcoidia bacterium]|nr:DNA-3-methyladenine glycosylase I [Dehalococcoidia bacterium]
MQPPGIIKPVKLAGYLEVISKTAFASGMRWNVVEAKWSGFRDTFHEFDPEYVTSLSPADSNTPAADPRIIRNRRKIEGTIHNANAMLTLDEHHRGSANYLASFPGFESLSRTCARSSNTSVPLALTPSSTSWGSQCHSTTSSRQSSQHRVKHS